MLRHRILAALFLTCAPALCQVSQMEKKFDALRKSPPQLHEFLYRMPKGADLHNHLSGAAYAEGMLTAAARAGLCVDPKQLKLVAPTTGSSTCPEGLVSAKVTQTDNSLANSLIDVFSMRNFVPSAGQSGHDHFFATFSRFGPIEATDIIAEVVQRAANQNESYLELMALSGGGAISNLGRTTGFIPDFAMMRQKLEGAGLAKLVTGLRGRVDQLETARTQALACGTTPESAACHVKVGYMYQVLRESPPEQVFAQVLAGFALAASDPRVVAVNFVQPEDGLFSMRDYHLHMQMVDYAKKIYPAVHISLHAGELWIGLVPPEGLRFHIREAIELGHAERIGHGVDIMFETGAPALLAEMKAKHVAVEINLTSNDGILGVTGARHPFPVYRKFDVPVALSTDDEGVSRSDLTAEFERAVLTYNLSYADLKQMVRNSLEYSFLPGKSYWATSAYKAAAPPCTASRTAAACRSYLEGNEKARLEADLEDKFAKFEK